MPDDQKAPDDSEPLRELTFGRSSQSAPSAKKAGPARQADESLSALATRCRDKSQALKARVEQERTARDRLAAALPLKISDLDLADWAQSILDAFQWATLKKPELSSDMTALDTLAGCYETAAEAATLLHSLSNRRGSLVQSVQLLAEAQSGLRAALLAIQAPDDPDQLELFELVRLTAAREHIFLSHFMRADDLAKPQAWPELLARIETAAGNHPRSKQQRALLAQIQTQLTEFSETTAATSSWPAIFDSVTTLLAQGLPPSSVELRELLLPHLNHLPENEPPPPAFNLVLREIDQYLAARPDPDALPSLTESTSTEEVQRVRELLGGRSLVLIGGLRRPQAQLQLEKELGLDALIWIATREHQSIDGFETVIARPEVAAVLLAIRWASHSFGDIKLFCDRHHKPLVRLPAGYGPNQVATQILAQGSAQLARP